MSGINVRSNEKVREKNGFAFFFPKSVRHFFSKSSREFFIEMTDVVL